jgi:GAF domain-containing protein
MNDKLDLIEKLTKKLQRSEDIIQSITKIQGMYLLNEPKEKIFNSLLSIILTSTNSEYGFIGEIKYDPATGDPFLKTYAITNIAWDVATRKFYEENAPTGLEFRNLDTLFGETIKTGKVIMTNDPASHESSAGIPPGHPPLDAYLGVPLLVNDVLIGMFGISNRPEGYDQEILKEINPIIDATAKLVFAQRNKDNS